MSDLKDLWYCCAYTVTHLSNCFTIFSFFLPRFFNFQFFRTSNFTFVLCSETTEISKKKKLHLNVSIDCASMLCLYHFFCVCVICLFSQFRFVSSAVDLFSSFHILNCCCWIFETSIQWNSYHIRSNTHHCILLNVTRPVAVLFLFNHINFLFLLLQLNCWFAVDLWYTNTYSFTHSLTHSLSNDSIKKIAICFFFPVFCLYCCCCFLLLFCFLFTFFYAWTKYILMKANKNESCINKMKKKLFTELNLQNKLTVMKWIVFLFWLEFFVVFVNFFFIYYFK